jgi:hypothetical protein
VAIPLKIKIFSWQPALDKLPSSSQIVIRQSPSDGSCAVCGEFEDASHIFFKCSLARFAWSVLRQLLGCNWNPSNFAQFHHILSSLAGASHRWLWLLFLAQSWALWQVRNKMTIERKFINHPSAIIFKTMIFLQLRSINSKTRDQAGNPDAFLLAENFFLEADSGAILGKVAASLAPCHLSSLAPLVALGCSQDAPICCRLLFG